MNDEKQNLPIFESVNFSNSPSIDLPSYYNYLQSYYFQSDWSGWPNTWYSKDNITSLQQADDLLNTYLDAVRLDDEQGQQPVVQKKQKRNRRKRKRQNSSGVDVTDADKEGFGIKQELHEVKIFNENEEVSQLTYESTPVKGKARPSHDDIIEDIDNVLDLIDPCQGVDINMFQIEQRKQKPNGCHEKIKPTKFQESAENELNGFLIWKKKYRKLVKEEYPDALSNEIEERMSDIWNKIPSSHREKYCSSAYKQTIKTKTEKYDVNIKTIVKPIPIKPDKNREKETVAVDPDNNCETKKKSINYRECMKECPTFQSPDRWMKRRVEAKRNIRKIESNVEEILSENKIATGYLQDLMLNSVSADIDNQSDLLSTVNLLDVNLLLTQENADFNELSCYILGDEQISTQEKLDSENLADFMNDKASPLEEKSGSLIPRHTINSKLSRFVRILYIKDFLEMSQVKNDNEDFSITEERQRD